MIAFKRILRLRRFIPERSINKILIIIYGHFNISVQKLQDLREPPHVFAAEKSLPGLNNIEFNPTRLNIPRVKYPAR